jgi:hypothetical protein
LEKNMIKSEMKKALLKYVGFGEKEEEEKG